MLEHLSGVARMIHQRKKGSVDYWPISIAFQFAVRMFLNYRWSITAKSASTRESGVGKILMMINEWKHPSCRIKELVKLKIRRVWNVTKNYYGGGGGFRRCFPLPADVPCFGIQRILMGSVAWASGILYHSLEILEIGLGRLKALRIDKSLEMNWWRYSIGIPQDSWQQIEIKMWFCCNFQVTDEIVILGWLQVYLKCEKTGYRADLEFKLKPMLGGADFMNFVTGKLRLGKETLATISGYWDDCISIEDKRTGEKQTLWNATNGEVRSQRLKRCTVAFDEQMDYESEKLWSKVSAAIHQENQVTPSSLLPPVSHAILFHFQKEIPPKFPSTRNQIPLCDARDAFGISEDGFSI